MFQLWKWSMIVCMSQAATFAGVFFVSRMYIAGDSAFVLAALAIILVAVALIPVTTVATVAVCAALAVVFGIVSVPAALGFFALAVFMIFVAAERAEEMGAREPRWALGITAIPAGIGAVLGGALYLFYFRNKNRVAV